MFENHMHLIYMCKEDLALNTLQGLIYHKPKPTKQTNLYPYYQHPKPLAKLKIGYMIVKVDT